MKYQELQLTSSWGEEARNLYYNGIQKVVSERVEAAKQKRRDFISPEKLKGRTEEYRRQYIQMLGWPLTEYREGTAVPYKKELLEETGFVKIYRLRLETLPGMWYEGILYEPTARKEGCPLVIQHPGGGYFVENLIAHGEHKCDQCKNIGGRFLEDGMLMFCPQNLIWNDAERGINTPADRNRFDVQLKAVGGSMMALEIYNVECTIDYLIAHEKIDETKIGMMGLSYGGFFTLYASAADPRIKSAFVSCSFFDRFKDPVKMCRPDLFWQDSAFMFGEAEIAALIAPRALYIENGVNDELYPYDQACEEYAETEKYFEVLGARDKLLFYRSEGVHEVAEGSTGYDFFVGYLND